MYIKCVSFYMYMCGWDCVCVGDYVFECVYGILIFCKFLVIYFLKDGNKLRLDLIKVEKKGGFIFFFRSFILIF